MGYFESKSGLKVDLVARIEGTDIGFIFEDSEKPSSTILRTAESFLADHKASKVILLNANEKGARVDKNILQLPWAWIV